VIEAIRKRVSSGPIFLSFDIDFIDPAFAPGTGTPEVGGFTSAEAQQFLRALTGIHFVAFDVVEVLPSYDGAGQVTALLAANIAWEMLALLAVQKKREQTTNPKSQPPNSNTQSAI
jgi:agmatinase